MIKSLGFFLGLGILAAHCALLNKKTYDSSGVEPNLKTFLQIFNSAGVEKCLLQPEYLKSLNVICFK